MFVPFRRLLVPLAALLLWGATAPPAAAQISAGFVVGLIRRVQRNKRRRFQRRRARARAELAANVAAALERMKSRFQDQRREGLAEMLAWSKQHQEGEIELQHTERIGVVLEQLLRDKNWKIRMDAQQARVYLGLVAPEELQEGDDTETRVAHVFPRDEEEQPSSTIQAVEETVPPPPRWLIGDGEAGADELY